MTKALTDYFELTLLDLALLKSWGVSLDADNRHDPSPRPVVKLNVPVACGRRKKDNANLHDWLQSRGWASMECGDGRLAYCDPDTNRWYHQERAAHILADRLTGTERNQ